MNYSELIVKALKGRSVNSVAKEWGVRQPTLDRWLKGQGLPDYNTTMRMADDAQVSIDEAVRAIAAEERILKVKSFKLQMGFVQIPLLALLAAGTAITCIYIMSNGVRIRINGLYRSVRTLPVTT